MIGRRPKESTKTTRLYNRPKEIDAAIYNQWLTKRWAINITIQIHNWLFKLCPILEQVRLVNERILQKHLKHRSWDCRIPSLTKCWLVEEDAWDRLVAQAVAMAEAETGKQLEDPLLQEAKAQTKDNLTRERKLCGLEVQACKLGKHIENMQM